jgi:inosine-uridine nucleoside N-ribohydrolase
MFSTLDPARRPGVPYRVAIEMHGQYLDLPAAHSQKQPQHAVDWLIDTYMASQGDITLVGIGPLTNLAMAFRREPRMVEKIPEIVLMGGGYAVGNRSPLAEFNVWMDPEAARVVINCGRPIRMVPLDATHKAKVSQKDCGDLRALGTVAGDAAARFVERRIAGYKHLSPLERDDAAPVHDALAVCAILDPSVIKTVFVNVDVETRGELTDGCTVCDVYNTLHKEPNVHVALDADEPKFVKMLLENLARK